MRLLIDENLSPRLARWAYEQGIPAEAAVHVGLAGAKDDAAFAHALAHDQAATMEVHPGVIALREAGLSAEQQWLRVQSAMQLIQHGKAPDLINRVLQIQSKAMHVWHEIPAS